MYGAAGKTYSTPSKLLLREGSCRSRLDQPAGVSPKPCRKIRALPLHVDWLLDVAMARAAYLLGEVNAAAKQNLASLWCIARTLRPLINRKAEESEGEVEQESR